LHEFNLAPRSPRSYLNPMGDSETLVPDDGAGTPPIEPLSEQRKVMARDPVCGIDVDPATAAASVEYAGVIYYFCRLSCRNEFQANPARYAG
jgi:YHS domain-containing protein